MAGDPGWPGRAEVCAKAGDEFVRRLLCGLPALPQGWFGSVAVPGPWDLRSVPTVPRPAEQAVALCHAGIPFPRGCQVRAA